MKTVRNIFLVLAFAFVASFVWGKIAVRYAQADFAKSFAKFQSGKTFSIKKSYGWSAQIPDWDGNGWTFESYQLEYINPDGNPSGITLGYDDCAIDRKKFRAGDHILLISSDEQTGGHFQQNRNWECYTKAELAN